MKPFLFILAIIFCALFATAQKQNSQNETGKDIFKFSLADVAPQDSRCDSNNPDPHYPPPSKDPNESIACAEKAYSGPFSREESIDLCQGAHGIAPATCAQAAYNGPYSKSEAIQLCRRAVSNAPIDCASDAYSGPFSKEESIQLCAKARSKGPSECAKNVYAGPFTKVQAVELCSFNGDIANAECAKKAYSGPYSKDEAVRVCKEHPNLTMRSLNIIEKAFELKGVGAAAENKLKLQNFLKVETE